MHISGLDLGAWVTVYTGAVFLRSSMASAQVDDLAADPRKKLAVVGYGLLALGVVILYCAIRFR
jgi:uncharacterized protein YjeT (DUF2065 family)